MLCIIDYVILDRKYTCLNNHQLSLCRSAYRNSNKHSCNNYIRKLVWFIYTTFLYPHTSVFTVKIDWLI